MRVREEGKGRRKENESDRGGKERERKREIIVGEKGHCRRVVNRVVEKEGEERDEERNLRDSWLGKQ